ncbi:MAG: DUF4445 domain-containing protein [Lachnospiraceae bacterium]|nr:DUF4445 domain-containing protein [Lachnospiraceae bacterium]
MEQILINGQSAFAEKGTLLSDVLQETGGYKMPCGGQGHCGKCKVYAVGALSEPDSVERRFLTEQELKDGIRLACRTIIEGPAESRFETQKNAQILLGGQQDAAAKNTVTGSKPLFDKLGVAIDIGTTTLAAQLYDESGLLSQAGADNPQAVFGADVISRIEKSLAGEGRALAQAIRRGLSGLLTELCKKAGKETAQIDTLVITGNTAMLYLLTERNPDCLSKAPFIADWLAGEWIAAKELELPCENAKVWLPHCMSAFVGADITTALLANDIRNGESLRMLVDIGTNGEITLWKNGELFCCSTAAGPAFEGAGLSMGMQGEEGAVSYVKLADEVDAANAGDMVLDETSGFWVHVIGNTTPRGICGSGVIDAVRCLLVSEIMDETGFLEDEEAVIAGNVLLDQEDIRKVQLAKSAICAGMEAMLNKAELKMEEVDELLIAGGFGSFLNLESARTIGLLPRSMPKKTTVCGNAALKGAAQLLLNADRVEESREIAASAQALNLATDPFFIDCYMEGMLFE